MPDGPDAALPLPAHQVARRVAQDSPSQTAIAVQGWGSLPIGGLARTVVPVVKRLPFLVCLLGIVLGLALLVALGFPPLRDGRTAVGIVVIMCGPFGATLGAAGLLVLARARDRG